MLDAPDLVHSGRRDPLSPMCALHQILAAEAKRLAHRAPYLDTMPEPLWRTFVHGDRDVAAWVYVPEPKSERPPPLVVLLDALGARIVAANPSLAVELRSLGAPIGEGDPPASGVGRVLGLERAFDALLDSLE